MYIFDTIFNDAMKLYEATGIDPVTKKPVQLDAKGQPIQQQTDPTGKTIDPAATQPSGTPAVAGSQPQQQQQATPGTPQPNIPGQPTTPQASAAPVNPAAQQTAGAPVKLTPEQLKSVQAFPTMTPQQQQAYIQALTNAIQQRR